MSSCRARRAPAWRKRKADNGQGEVILYFLINYTYYIVLSALRQGCYIETAFQVVVAFYLLGKMMMEKSDKITKMRILSTSTSV